MTGSEKLRYTVIMAGGYGERLWPLSRSKRPKQLLKLLNDGQSLLGSALQRIAPLIPLDRSYIVTNKTLQDIIRDGLPELPAENVIAEPSKRNTSACLALAAARLIALHPDSEDDITMAVLTADHRIENDDAFRETAAEAMEIAEREDNLVIMGVHPTRPETSYGYVEVEETISEGSLSQHPMRVLRFREKPNREVAEDFIATGRFFWNSGMFFWRLSVFMHELDEAMPTLAMATREMADCFRRGGEAAMDRLSRLFEGLADVSIDYGLMEKSTKVTLIPARFVWDDLGSWEALRRARPKDREGNVTEGDPVLIDTQNSVVYNAEGPEKLAVAVVGLQGVTVVGTSDAVLVCPTDRSQDLRKAVSALKQRYPNHI